MTSCSVKNCKNNTKINKKKDGLTFHIFPKISKMKDEWIVAIRNSRNEPQWEPAKTSVVCSNHFDEGDLYFTKCGLRRVNRNAYPKKNLFSPSKYEVADNSDNTLASTSSTSELQIYVADLPVVAADNISLYATPNRVTDETPSPSTSLASSLNGPDSPVVATDNISLYATPNGVADNATLPSTPPHAKSNMSDDQIESIFDTPRKHKLRKQFKKQEHLKNKYHTKIKTLQQKVRRLKNRNKSLKNILKKLKKQN